MDSEPGLYAVLIGGLFILLLFLFNLRRTVKQGAPSLAASRLLYVVAIITVLGNICRTYSSGMDSTFMAANVIALICIAVTAKRGWK